MNYWSMTRRSRNRNRERNPTRASRSRVNRRNTGGGGFGGLPPSLRAAMIMWTFVGMVAFINTFTAGTALLLTFPLQLILYMITGALAANFALNDGYEQSGLPTVGAQAGFFNWILPAVIYLVLSLVGISVGIGLFGIAAWILCGPIDLGVHVVMGAFGAWFYKNFAR